MSAQLDMSHDWRDIPLPDNIHAAENCFLQSAQIFGMYHSSRKPGLIMGKGSGIYSQSQLIVGPAGQVILGDYSCINSATLQCETEIRIGAHCLVAWGVVISDSLPDAHWPLERRRHALLEARKTAAPPCWGAARPVVLGDNVWVGFGATILPGVTIGEGSIIATKSVIENDVPPYVVVAGSPGRIVKQLERPALVAAAT